MDTCATVTVTMAFLEIVRQIGASFVLFHYDLSSYPFQKKSPAGLLILVGLFSPELDLKSDSSCLLTGFQASERPLA